MKKRLWIILAISLPSIIVVISVLVYQANHRPHDLEDIIESKRLRVVTEYSSIGYFVEDGQIKGFQYELVNLFAQSIGVTPEFIIEPDLRKSIKGVNNGDYDLILRALPITLELKKEIVLSQPILKSQLVLVQRVDGNQDKPIRNVLDLDGITIYTSPHSPYIMRLHHIEEELGIVFHISSIDDVDNELLMAMVARGEIDYTIGDEFTARLMASYYPELDIKTVLGFKQYQAWGLSKPSIHLQKAVNKWLKEFTSTKEFRDLYRIYYR